MNRPTAIASLTGLRFVAAFSVLVAHATNWIATFNPTPEFVGYLSWGSAIGMPLFFVLSGFVIHYNYGAQFRHAFVEPTVDFFIARFARLYPLYLFCLFLYLALHQQLLIAFINGNDFSLWRFLVLWQAWSIEYQNTTWVGHLLLPPAWSISVEVFFYALYPGLALYFLKLRSARWSAISFVAIAVGYYAVIVWCYLNFDELRVWGNETFVIDADPQNALLGWLFNTGPLGRFWEFLMGVLAAQAYMTLQHLKPSRTEARIGTLVMLGSLVVSAILYWLSPVNSLVAFAGGYPGGFAPIFTVLIFCCARYRNFVTALLSTRFIVALGEASYSIYLLHLFTLELFRQGVPFSPDKTHITNWLLLMLAAIAFTLILSLGTYQVVELPARAFLRRTLHSLKRRAMPVQLPVTRLSWAARPFSIIFIVLGVVVWNVPAPRGPITVISASYGANCAAVAPPPPYTNNFRSGNADIAVKKACRSVDRCKFLVNVNALGDPVNGCAKDFAVAYSCAHEMAGTVHEATVGAEANGKALSLDCRDAHR